jgi:hypothetical protein
MVLSPLFIIVVIVAIPIGICLVGKYFVHKAYRRRERRNGKRPVQNADIELGVLEPNNTCTQNRRGLEVHRTSASASTPSFGAAIQINGFDRVSTAASSSKIPQVAEMDGAFSLKRESQSWATAHSRGDMSPPEGFAQATTPSAHRSVSPVEQQWPLTHPPLTLTYKSDALRGFQDVYEQPKRRDLQRIDGIDEKTPVGDAFDVLESDVGSLGSERRKGDSDRQKALDVLEGNI